MVGGPTTIVSALVCNRQWPVLVVFVVICAQLLHWYFYFQQPFYFGSNYYQYDFGGVPTQQANEDPFCICDGSATKIQDNISLSSPFFKVNDFFIRIGTNHSSCYGIVPDGRKHVFVSVAHFAYGHFVFNGVAPLWDKLRSEGLLQGGTATTTTRHDDQENPLVLHVIAGQRNDTMLHNSYVREYLELFGGEFHTYSRSSFLQQRFLLRSMPILGLGNVSLDHYNREASSQLWKEFREFLIQGLPQLRHRYSQQLQSNNTFPRWRITIIQRQENRRLRKLNGTVADMQGILQQKKTEMSFSIQVVKFENMSVVDQATVMSETDILIGADGTGIMNGLYLPGKESCVIAVLPFGVRELIPHKGQNFATLFAKLGIKYISLESSPLRRKSHKIYHMAKTKATTLERWFMLRQNLNVSAQQLVSAIQSCLE